MQIKNVKGCIDYLTKEQKVRNYINEKIKETFEEYSYLPIETPIICYYDLLAGKYDENNDLLKEIYKLSDQGKRNLGLRYDLTVPFAKFIALNKNKINFPFKRYEIAKVFRDGPIKLGRDREFTQCDADVVGLSGQMIEAECLSLYVSAFKKLNINIIIKYNSRNLMRGLIIDCNVEKELINKVITIIDKFDKISNNEFKSLLKEISLDNKQIDKLLNLFTLSLEDLTNKYKNTNIELLKQGLGELNNLEDYIKTLELDKYCIFTPTLARGQDYYTGNVFEVYKKNYKLNCSIGGGGRYDNMITNYISDGNPYPAVGISFGLSSIYELLKEEDLFNNETSLYIIPMDAEKYSLKLANKLRNRGIKVIVEMNKRKVKKCFEWANKNNISYVTVIGENEINTNTFNIKNMNTGNNLEFNINDINKIVDTIKQ